MARFATIIGLLALAGCQLAYSTRRTEGGRELIYAIPEDQAFLIARTALQDVFPEAALTEVVKARLRVSTRGFASGSLATGFFEVFPLRIRGIAADGESVTGYSLRVLSRGGGLEQKKHTRAIMEGANRLLEKTGTGVWVSRAERSEYESVERAATAGSRPVAEARSLSPPPSEPTVEAEAPVASHDRPPAPHATAACFVVRRDGVILTARHAVNAASSIRVRLIDGEWHEAKVDHSSEELGLSLLRIEARTPDFLPLAASGSPKPNEAVLGFRIPSGDGPGVEPRVVRGAVMEAPEGHLRISWPSGEATPGSPLLDERGEAIAIFVARPVETPDQGPNETVTASNAQRLYDRPLAIGRTPDRKERIRRARDALCLVVTEEGGQAR